MAVTTNISWCDATWGIFYGCSRVSTECENCYAEQVVAGLARKFKTTNPKAYAFYEDLTRETNNGPQWTGVVKLHREHLFYPLKWTEPKKIFVNSLSDVFHEKVKREDQVSMFAVMATAWWHTFQILTKRPERMRDLLQDPKFAQDVLLEAGFINASDSFKRNQRLGKNHPANLSWPLPNVWLGTSVGNQKAAEQRITPLLETPAVIRFLSCEPLLEKLDLIDWLYWPSKCKSCGGYKNYYEQNPKQISVDTCSMGGFLVEDGEIWCPDCKKEVSTLPTPDWIICGGESGAGFREMNPEWAIDLKNQAEQAGIAFFYKQDSAIKSGTRPFLIENGVKKEWKQFPGEACFSKIVIPKRER